ncbi:MAG: NADH:ubiquinone reductase (Na(+)-transporting) subunit C [bacterium]
MNTTKNSYTLIYMTIMIVIVSLLLSITSGALKGRQNENIKLDKKKQILSSLPIIDLSTGDAAEIYATTIKEFNILNAEGETVKQLNPVDDFDYRATEGEFPIYIAEVEGATKYIIPLNGKGLWGAIWGYIALNDNRNTVYGVFFAHASETPGLGANIVTDNFRNPFVGKEIIKDGQFASIAIMKVGQKAVGQDQVDALSGGTITSKGVEAMLQSSLVDYTAFCLMNTSSCSVAEEVAAEISEVSETEETETEVAVESEVTECESKTEGGNE